jgi:uncharacterized membrane protein YdjX (TVP38/TMEM64 family)
VALENKIDNIPDKEPTWGELLKNLVFVALIITVAYFVATRFNLEDIRRSVESFGIYAPLLVVLLKATTIVVVPLGGGPLYPIAGVLFGFPKAIFLTLLGDVIGSTISFYISRKFGWPILKFFMPSTYMPTVTKLIEKCSDPKTFLKARLFFTGFPELFSYAAGFTKINFIFFILIHISIHAIPASIAVLFGDVLVSGSKMLSIASGALLSVLAFAGIWWFHADMKESS